jgi:hypothetical protein
MKTSRCWHQMSVVELALISTDLAPTVSMLGTGTSRPISGGSLVCRIILVTRCKKTTFKPGRKTASDCASLF